MGTDSQIALKKKKKFQGVTDIPPHLHQVTEWIPSAPLTPTSLDSSELLYKF